ncbi:MAG TPA: EsaB/YukD family protein [Blastocatellia bacterium]|nr:EsaB/YukD family protein [Blastocatellia bacterium]
MPTARVRILDVTGSRSCDVEADDDIEVNRIMVLLVEKMNLPLTSPDGQIMSYKLHLRRTGTQLLDNMTLAQSGVIDGDQLRLQPEITAGALPTR